jgi:hypothetical protein
LLLYGADRSQALSHQGAIDFRLRDSIRSAVVAVACRQCPSPALRFAARLFKHYKRSRKTVGELRQFFQVGGTSRGGRAVRVGAPCPLDFRCGHGTPLGSGQKNRTRTCIRRVNGIDGNSGAVNIRVDRQGPGEGGRPTRLFAWPDACGPRRIMLVHNDLWSVIAGLGSLDSLGQGWTISGVSSVCSPVNAHPGQASDGAGQHALEVQTTPVAAQRGRRETAGSLRFAPANQAGNCRPQ